MWPQQSASGNEKRSETQQHICSAVNDITLVAAGVINKPALTSKQTDDIATLGEWVTQEGLHGLVKLCMEVEVFGLCAKSCHFIDSN